MMPEIEILSIGSGLIAFESNVCDQVTLESKKVEYFRK